MRIVGKFKDKDIRLDSLHMDKTYGGFLAGPSANRMEECNTRILSRLEGDTCRTFFGEGRPVVLMGREGLDLKKPLPDVYGLAWLTCEDVVRDPSCHGSHVIMIWFQDPADDPFKKISMHVADLDWSRHAEDFQY